MADAVRRGTIRQIDPGDDRADHRIVQPQHPVRVAIIGRPNVGKSSLLNALLGQERAIVSDVPGTTRDAIDTAFEWAGRTVRLVDTAGIRRRGKIDPGVEKYSVLRALKTLRRADVALLLIDGEEGVTAQDAHIGGMLTEENVGVIILINKWDIVEKDAYTMPTYEKKVRGELAFLSYAPLLFVSAETGQRLNKIFPTVLEVQS